MLSKTYKRKYSLWFPATDGKTAGSSEDGSNEGQQGDCRYSQRVGQFLELVYRFLCVVSETALYRRPRLVRSGLERVNNWVGQCEKIWRL